jgi:hypothetical protein
VLHQSGVLQDLEVFADRRPTDGQLIGELTDGARTGAQPFQDAAAGRIAERIQHDVSCQLVTHEQPLL